MSWRDTLTTAQARLVALEAAELQMLAGNRPTRVQYDGGAVDYGPGASLADLKRDLFECRTIIANFGGACRTGGSITPVFRG